MAARVAIAVLAAILLATYAAPLAGLLTDLLRGAAVLIVVALGLWLMVRAPFQDRS